MIINKTQTAVIYEFIHCQVLTYINNCISPIDIAWENYYGNLKWDVFSPAFHFRLSSWNLKLDLLEHLSSCQKHWKEKGEEPHKYRKWDTETICKFISLLNSMQNRLTKVFWYIVYLYSQISFLTKPQIQTQLQKLYLTQTNEPQTTQTVNPFGWIYLFFCFPDHAAHKENTFPMSHVT